MADEQPTGARTELGADAFHLNDEGEYYIDCPECGSAATIMNVARHGRCNGYLDQQEDETELDEEEMECTARLAFELVWDSDPGPDERDDAVADETGTSRASGGEDGAIESADSEATGGLVDDADADRPAESDGE